MSGSSHTDNEPSEDGSRWTLVIAVASTSVLAGGLIAIGAWYGLSSALRLDFAKAGLNLIVLAVLGAGVTAAVQRRAGQRELQRELEAEKREHDRSLKAEEREERRRREAEDREEDRKRFAEIQESRRQDSAYALSVLRDIIANYNRLKAARRAMRAVGLDNPGPAAMSPAQATTFKEQMQVLGEVQLAFEGIARELDTRLDEDVSDDGAKRGEAGAAGYQIAIDRLASYVERVVREWERYGRDVAVGDDPDAIASRESLQAFLRSSRTDARKEFRTNAAESLRALQLFFRQRLLVPLLLEEPTSVKTTPPDRGPMDEGGQAERTS